MLAAMLAPTQNYKRGRPMRKFDMGEAWQQVAAMFRGNREILITVAGLFFFLPTLIFTLVYPEPPVSVPGETAQQMIDRVMEYYRVCAPGLLLSSLVSIIGNLAIWRLLLAEGGTSLGGALSTSLTLFLSYLAASIISGFAIGLGFLLLIVPGLYLTCRLGLIGPAMTAEKIMNPITAISASWNYTRNNGWVILLFMVILVIVGWIAIIITGAIFGALFALLLPENIANIGNKTVQALLGSGLSLILTLAMTSVYRQLGPYTNKETFA